MWKALSAMSAAALVAGFVSLLPGFNPEAAATAPALAAKTDRADLPQSCPDQGWPYYKASCLRDESRNAGRVPQIRIISTDRVHLSQPDAPVFEPMPHVQISKVDLPANPLSVPAWPDYMDNLKVLAVR